MFLTTLEIRSFQRTALTAYHGTLAIARIVCFEVNRTYRYLSSEEAIAFYRYLWHCLKLAMALAIVAGMATRSLWEFVRQVDATVERSTISNQNTDLQQYPSDVQHSLNTRHLTNNGTADTALENEASASVAEAQALPRTVAPVQRAAATAPKRLRQQRQVKGAIEVVGTVPL